MKKYILLVLTSLGHTIVHAPDATEKLLITVATYQVLQEHASKHPTSPPLSSEQLAQQKLNELTYNVTATKFEPTEKVAEVLAYLQGLHLDHTVKLEMQKNNGTKPSIAITHILKMLSPPQTDDKGHDGSDDEPALGPSDLFGDDEDYEDVPTPEETDLAQAQELVKDLHFSSSTHFFVEDETTQKAILENLQGLTHLSKTANLTIAIEGTATNNTMTAEQVINTIKAYLHNQKHAADKIKKTWQQFKNQKQQAQAVATSLHWTTDPIGQFTESTDELQAAKSTLLSIKIQPTVQLQLGSGQTMSLQNIQANIQKTITRREQLIRMQKSFKMRQARARVQAMLQKQQAQQAVNVLTWDNGQLTNPVGVLRAAQEILQQLVTQGLDQTTQLRVAGHDSLMTITDILAAIELAAANQAAQKANAEKAVSSLRLEEGKLHVIDGITFANIAITLSLYPGDLEITVPGSDTPQSIKNIIMLIVDTSKQQAQPIVENLVFHSADKDDQEAYFTVQTGANTTIEAAFASLNSMGLPSQILVSVSNKEGTFSDMSLLQVQEILTAQKVQRETAALRLQAKWRQVHTRSKVIQTQLQQAVQGLTYDTEKNLFEQNIDELLIVKAKLAELLKAFKASEMLKVIISEKEFSIKTIINAIAEEYDAYLHASALAIQKHWRGYLGRKTAQSKAEQKQEQEKAAREIQKIWKGHQQRTDASPLKQSRTAAQQAVAHLRWNNEKQTLHNTTTQLQTAQQQLKALLAAKTITAQTQVSIPAVSGEAYKTTVAQVRQHIAAILLQAQAREKQTKLTPQQQAQKLLNQITYNTSTKRFEPVDKAAEVTTELKKLQLSKSEKLNVKKGATTVAIELKDIFAMLKKPTPADDKGDDGGDGEPSHGPSNLFGHDSDDEDDHDDEKQQTPAHATQGPQTKSEDEKVEPIDPSTLEGAAILQALAQRGDKQEYPTSLYNPQVPALWTKYLQAHSRLETNPLRITFEIPADQRAVYTTAVTKTKSRRIWEEETITLHGKEITLDQCFTAIADHTTIDVRETVEVASLLTSREPKTILEGLVHGVQATQNHTEKTFTLLSEAQQLQLWSNYFTYISLPQTGKIAIQVPADQRELLTQAAQASNLVETSTIQVHQTQTMLRLCLTLATQNMSLLNLTLAATITSIMHQIGTFSTGTTNAIAYAIFEHAFKAYMENIAYVYPGTLRGTYIAQKRPTIKNNKAPKSAGEFKKAVQTALRLNPTWKNLEIAVTMATQDGYSTSKTHSETVENWITKHSYLKEIR